MRKRKPNHANEVIKQFTSLCDNAFKAKFAEYGFSRIDEKNERYYSHHIYRNVDLYAEVFANTDPRDAPNYCGVKLGEGDHEWPETDWNSIALWQLVEAKAPQLFNDDDESYELKSIEDLENVLAQMSEHLFVYAKDFLEGDLTLFHSIRAKINQGREPYKIYRPTESGEYTVTLDEGSSELKEKFSK